MNPLVRVSYERKCEVSVIFDLPVEVVSPLRAGLGFVLAPSQLRRDPGRGLSVDMI